MAANTVAAPPMSLRMSSMDALAHLQAARIEADTLATESNVSFSRFLPAHSITSKRGRRSDAATPAVSIPFFFFKH